MEHATREKRSVVRFDCDEKIAEESRQQADNEQASETEDGSLSKISGILRAHLVLTRGCGVHLHENIDASPDQTSYNAHDYHDQSIGLRFRVLGSEVADRTENHRDTRAANAEDDEHDDVGIAVHLIERTKLASRASAFAGRTIVSVVVVAVSVSFWFV